MQISRALGRMNLMPIFQGVPGSREIADKCRIRVDVESECESESGMKKLRIEKYPHTGPKGVSSF